jgi:ribosomal protein L11 methyltransferase
VIVANILADVILGMAGALVAGLKPDGTPIASGIIENRADDVRRGLVATGLARIETQTEGEWVALVARR